MPPLLKFMMLLLSLGMPLLGWLALGLYYGRGPGRRGASGGLMGSATVRALLFGAFAGVMLATAGGAIYPQLWRVSEPFVCEGGFELESAAFSYKPGQRGVERILRCQADDGGPPQVVTTRAVAVSALIYAGGFFVLLRLADSLLLALAAPLFRWMGGWQKRRRDALIADWRSPQSDPRGDPAMETATLDALRTLIGQADHVTFNHEVLKEAVRAQADDIATRLLDLKSLRDRGLVTAQEYETKKAEILSQL